MSVYEGTCSWADRKQWRRSGHGAWKPLELAAMIVGFAVFWPVGLGILVAKIGQRRERFEGDLFSYVKEKIMASVPETWTATRDHWASKWGQTGFGFGGMSSSGNHAFDEWRAAELERLEAERRKLADAEREFAEHLERLRRARDREEFDRFMAERNARQNGGTTQV